MGCSAIILWLLFYFLFVIQLTTLDLWFSQFWRGKEYNFFFFGSKVSKCVFCVLFFCSFVVVQKTRLLLLYNALSPSDERGGLWRRQRLTNLLLEYPHHQHWTGRILPGRSISSCVHLNCVCVGLSLFVYYNCIDKLCYSA